MKNGKTWQQNEFLVAVNCLNICGILLITEHYTGNTVCLFVDMKNVNDKLPCKKC